MSAESDRIDEIRARLKTARHISQQNHTMDSRDEDIAFLIRRLDDVQDTFQRANECLHEMEDIKLRLEVLEAGGPRL